MHLHYTHNNLFLSVMLALIPRHCQSFYPWISLQFIIRNAFMLYIKKKLFILSVIFTLIPNPCQSLSSEMSATNIDIQRWNLKKIIANLVFDYYYFSTVTRNIQLICSKKWLNLNQENRVSIETKINVYKIQIQSISKYKCKCCSICVFSSSPNCQNMG